MHGIKAWCGFARWGLAMIKRLMYFVSAALLCGATAGAASAQEVYNAGTANNSELYNGAGNSQPTGTQGQVGNSFCAAPHEIINGKDVVPLNWSCPTVQQPYVKPQTMTVARPGPPVQAGAANPCQPGGPGSYDFRNNPPGVPLPSGCVRPTNTATAPPGYYLRPEGRPGDYLQTDGRPGDYIVPDGSPGSYIQPTSNTAGSTPGSDPQPGPNEASSFVQPASGAPGYFVNANSQPKVAPQNAYRQDFGAMQSAVSNGH